MGKIGAGVKAGLIGGLVSGIFLASMNFIVMTVYKEAYVSMFKKVVEKLAEEYGVKFPQGSPEQAALIMYNLSRIQGSIYSIVIAVVIGIIVGVIVAKFYEKLPSKNVFIKSLLVSYIILAVKTGLSLATLSFGAPTFKPEELGIPQEVTILGYVTDILSYTFLGLIIGALYGKWRVESEETIRL